MIVIYYISKSTEILRYIISDDSIERANFLEFLWL